MIKRLFFIFYCLALSLSAQDSIPKNKLELSLNTYIGYLIPAYPDAPKSNFSILSSVGFQWQTAGKDVWHQFYRFPKQGFEIIYGSYNNKQQLGNSIGLVPSLEWRGKKSDRNWRFKFGVGVAYYDTPFDLISNPANFYIGRNFVNMTLTSILWTRRLNKDLVFTYGFSSIHASNGHTALPNAGMNIICGHLGLRFEKKREFTKRDVTAQSSLKTYVIKAGIGFHEFGSTTKAIGGPSFPSYHLSAWYSIPKKNIHLWQVGVTLAYYTSFYDYIKTQEVYDTDQKLRACNGIIFGGHEFIFGKFGFVSQLGINFYNPFFVKQKKIEGEWNGFGEKLQAINSNRLGIMYYPFKKRNSLNNISRQLSLGAFIKANVGQADLFEYSIGYSF